MSNIFKVSLGINSAYPAYQIVESLGPVIAAAKLKNDFVHAVEFIPGIEPESFFSIWCEHNLENYSQEYADKIFQLFLGF